MKFSPLMRPLNVSHSQTSATKSNASSSTWCYVLHNTTESSDIASNWSRKPSKNLHQLIRGRRGDPRPSWGTRIHFGDVRDPDREEDVSLTS